jgi:hypothetical protein
VRDAAALGELPANHGHFQGGCGGLAAARFKPDSRARFKTEAESYIVATLGSGSALIFRVGLAAALHVALVTKKLVRFPESVTLSLQARIPRD